MLAGWVEGEWSGYEVSGTTITKDHSFTEWANKRFNNLHDDEEREPFHVFTYRGARAKTNWLSKRRIASGFADFNNDHSFIHFLSTPTPPLFLSFSSAYCFGGNISLALSCIKGEMLLWLVVVSIMPFCLSPPLFFPPPKFKPSLKTPSIPSAPRLLVPIAARIPSRHDSLSSFHASILLFYPFAVLSSLLVWRADTNSGLGDNAKTNLLVPAAWSADKIKKGQKVHPGTFTE